MSVTYTCEFIAQPRHIKLVSLECSSAADTAAAFEEAARLLKNERDCPVLADARLWKYRPSFEDIKQFASSLAALQVFDGAFALVVGDDLQFGIASQLASVCAGYGIRMAAFKTVDEAYDWLQLDTAGAKRRI